MLYLISFALFFIVVTILANKGLIPAVLKVIPYYDSIGHFVLFGIYAFLAQMACKGRKYKSIPIGSGMIAVYAIMDEFLQKLSPNRTFDLHDLFFSLLGVSVATFMYIYYKVKLAHQ